jgi:ATP-binding cassette subfamily C (CFTR/MRP) protein 1
MPTTASEPKELDEIFDNGAVVAVADTTFAYSQSGEGFSLKNITLSIRRGELVMVVGPVGAGKSTLLNALLGELSTIKSGTSRFKHAIQSSSSVAYCAQKPWIVAATVKSNIVLGGQEGDHLADEDEETDIMKPDGFKNPKYINEELYQLALSKSRIEEDMKQWAHGDLTEIGERGISISGGQKARVALARALYADSDGKL